jgi:DNA-binding transcriptional ArsR family regulator
MMSTNVNELVGESIFGKVRRRILSTLFLHSGRTFYLLELIRLIASGRGAVQRELTRLTNAGLVERTRKGNQVHYRANEKALIFEELRAIFAKTTGLNDVVSGALKPFEDEIGLAFIHGAFAQGRALSDSEIELTVVTDTGKRKLESSLEDVTRKTGRRVKLIAIPVDDFKKLYTAGVDRLRNVTDSEKIFLIGSQAELDCLILQQYDLFSSAGVWS